MSNKVFCTYKKGRATGDKQTFTKNHNLEIQKLRNEIKKLKNALIEKEYKAEQNAMILARW